MKKRLIAIVVIASVLYSCTKNNDKSFNPSFRYTVGSTTAVTTDSSAAYLSLIANRPGILAWNKGSSPATFKIGFSVTSFQIGTYDLTPTVPGSSPPPTVLTNNFYYFDENRNELKVVNGAVNILSNENYRISGNFNVNLSDVQGSPMTLSGNFSDVPIKP